MQFYMGVSCVVLGPSTDSHIFPRPPEPTPLRADNVARGLLDWAAVGRVHAVAQHVEPGTQPCGRLRVREDQVGLLVRVVLQVEEAAGSAARTSSGCGTRVTRLDQLSLGR